MIELDIFIKKFLLNMVLFAIKVFRIFEQRVSNAEIDMTDTFEIFALLLGNFNGHYHRIIYIRKFYFYKFFCRFSSDYRHFISKFFEINFEKLRN